MKIQGIDDVLRKVIKIKWMLNTRLNFCLNFTTQNKVGQAPKQLYFLFID